MLDMEKIEKALLKIFAEVTGMTQGTNIFRGQIPDGKPDAVAVSASEESSSNEPEIPKFAVGLIGKFKARKDALTAYAKISQSMPVYGDNLVVVDSGTVLMAGILKRGSGGIYQQSDNGNKTWFFSINAVACVKST